MPNPVLNGTVAVAFAGIPGGPPIPAPKIINNMIHGGDSSASTNAGYAPGLTLSSVTGPIVQHNTILSGVVGGTNPTLSPPIQLGDAVTGAVVQNNILAGFGYSSSGVQVQHCASTGVFATFDHNAFFNDGSRLFVYTNSASESPCTKGESYTSIDAMVTALTGQTNGLVPVGGNVVVRASCSGDGGCVTHPACGFVSVESCFVAVFGTWDHPSDGKVNLFDQGWKLATSTPCAIAHGTLDLTSTVPKDLFGGARTPPPSVGAAEYDGACAP